MRIAVVIGKFSPFHRGHLHLIKETLKQLSSTDKLIIMIGSAYKARTIKVPWTETERIEMISSVLDAEGLLDNRILFRSLRDYPYSDERWVKQVKNAAIIDNLIEEPEYIVYGYKKDRTSYYLDIFPSWLYQQIEPNEAFKLINATDIRNQYFEGCLWNGYSTSLIHQNIRYYLFDFESTEEYRNLVAEYNFYKEYKQEALNYKYPIIYSTVDALVTYCNHILLIERKNHPGKGLLALPGGFVNPDERLLDAAIRETKEETGLTLYPEWLTNTFVADHPDRSLRGRTISHCFRFDIPENKSSPLLPKVEGSDDALNAQWRSINEVRNNLERLMYDDHQHIIEELLKSQQNI